MKSRRKTRPTTNACTFTHTVIRPASHLSKHWPLTYPPICSPIQQPSQSPSYPLTQDIDSVNPQPRPIHKFIHLSIQTHSLMHPPKVNPSRPFISSFIHPPTTVTKPSSPDACIQPTPNPPDIRNPSVHPPLAALGCKLGLVCAS